MKKFKLILCIILLLQLAACSKKIGITAKEPSWGRDNCERCVMAIDDRFYSAQVINPVDGKHYFFDDFGCATLWLKEVNPSWSKEAVVYVNDAKSGKWVNVKNAYFRLGYKTPMSFGVAVFADNLTVDNDKKAISYDDTKNVFNDIIAERKMREAAQHNPSKIHHDKQGHIQGDMK